MFHSKDEHEVSKPVSPNTLNDLLHLKYTNIQFVFVGTTPILKVKHVHSALLDQILKCWS